jgi:heme exporter protein A
MTAANIAIRVRGLSKAMGGRAVLRAIDLDVSAGQSVALTGANGAGKTTLLRCLAGVLRPTSGDVYWLGQPAWGHPAARHLVGMVAHQSLLYPQLTLRENLVFAARMHGLPQPLVRADELLEAIGMQRHADRTPATISQGMRQRLAIARALVHDPPILLCDEPFSGLDAAGVAWLSRVLVDLRDRGRTLVCALHDEEAIRRLADRVLEIRAGQLAERPAPGRGLAETTVSRAA